MTPRNVSKPTLGRGLGELLGDNRAGAAPDAPMKAPGVGLRILIEGAQPASEAAAPTAETVAATTPAPVAASPFAPTRSVTVAPARETDSELLTRLLAVLGLVGADLALLAWAAHHVLTQTRNLSATGIAACVVTVLLATLCGCAAARLGAVRG